MRFLFFLVCLGSTLCFAQPDNLLHQAPGPGYAYLESLRLQIDGLEIAKALDTLKPLEKWARDKGDRELAGELLLLQIKRKMIVVRQDDTIEEQLKNLVIAAEKNNFEFLKVDALQTLGDYYWDNNQKHSLALENYVEAYNTYNKFPGNEFPPKHVYLYALGGSYFRYEDYDNAIRYLKEAIAIKVPENTKADWSKTILNTLGLCYQKKNKIDSAAWYFQSIYDAAVRRNDTVWVGIAAGNIGNVYFLQKKYKEAIPMLETDVNNSLVTNQIKSAAGSLYKLSLIYYQLGDIDKSLQLVTRATDLCEQRNFWPYYPLAEQFYTQLSKVYAARNDMRRAYLYADSALTAKDSLTSERNKLNVARSQEKIDYIRHKLETGKLASEKIMQEWIRNSLVVLIFLMCLIGILFINRQRLKQKKLEAEKKSAESELDIASVQLENIRQSVQEKNQIIEHFTNQLERQKTGEETKTNDELLTQLERATILTDEQWENFRDVFEKVHKGFFTNLKRKIPDLTPAEIRFLALTKLKMTSKEMASMLGISTNAIRIYRHRLRKKLDLDKDDMIEALVESI